MRKTLLLLFWSLLVGVILAGASQSVPPLSQGQDEFIARPVRPTFRPTVTKRPGHYTKTDWRRAIDSVWGEGLPTQTKLAVLDSFKFRMDRLFACFNNLDFTRWDSLYAVFRAEVEDTVSQGRFAAMMSHLAMALKEPHTYIDDILVCEQTALLPGVPVFVIAGWRWDTHFGAGLTPLADSTLLVYEVDSNHPLGIVPGDVILGYDRRLWTECCRELLDAQLPIRRRYRWAAENRSLAHTLLISAGQNWHLFDTIDIARYPGSDTVRLPTSLMVGYEPDLVCCEELDVPGVPKPNLDSMKAATWGVIAGVNIGYIYVWVWEWDAASTFRLACSTLTADSSLKGIIVDYRYNEGGMDDRAALGGYRFLFSSESTFSFCGCVRSDPVNRTLMRVCQPSSYYAITGVGNGYAKPVAMLTGPGAWSMGDWEAYRTTLRPGLTRTFGRPTNGAFIENCTYCLIHSNFRSQYAYADLRRYDDSTGFLTHIPFEPDTLVWHTREAVAQGRDAVVEAAVTWINVAVGTAEVATDRRPDPTIVRGLLNMAGSRQQAGDRTELLDISGRKVMDLKPGANDLRHLSSGIYFVRSGPSAGSRQPSAVHKLVVTQ